MLPINVLKLIVRYDPETGEMHWKRRAAWVSDGGYQTEKGRLLFNSQFAGKKCLTSLDKDGYLYGVILGKFYRAHRVAYAISNGRWPENTVDHINRVRTDNRATNLRDATRAEQQNNRGVQKNNKSGVPGVHWSKSHKGWVARRTSEGKRIFIGVFHSIDEAAEAKRNYV